MLTGCHQLRWGQFGHSVPNINRKRRENNLVVHWRSIVRRFFHGCVQHPQSAHCIRGSWHTLYHTVFLPFHLTFYSTSNIYPQISYSIDESNLATSSYSEIKVFDSVVQKLGVMGVTIVTASGDNGINTSYTPKTPSCPVNPYVAQFPASSPYVLAVGATQGDARYALCVLDIPYHLVNTTISPLLQP